MKDEKESSNTILYFFLLHVRYSQLLKALWARRECEGKNMGRHTCNESGEVEEEEEESDGGKKGRKVEGIKEEGGEENKEGEAVVEVKKRMSVNGIYKLKTELYGTLIK